VEHGRGWLRVVIDVHPVDGWYGVMGGPERGWRFPVGVTRVPGPPGHQRNRGAPDTGDIETLRRVTGEGRTP
jgi:hypothetical protein